MGLLLLAVALLIGFAFFGEPEPLDSDRPVDDGRTIGQFVADGGGAHRPAIPAVDGERQSIATQAIGRAVRCLVLRGFDGSYPGARIRMELFAGVEPVGEPEHAATVSTDTEGLAIWQLPVVQKAAVHTCVVRVSSADKKDGGGAKTALLIRDGTRDVHLKLYLFPLDHEIFGRVEDGQGSPIESASIVMFFIGGRAQTDADGRFSVQASSAYPDALYGVIADGHGSIRGNVRVSGPGRTELRVVLPAGFRIFGRVSDKDGRGLQGTRVTTSQLNSMGKSVETDGDGNYEITSAPRGSEALYVSAELVGFARGRCKVAGLGSEARGDITLRRGGQVAGHVFGPNGAAVAGARVTAGSANPRNPRHRDVSSDDGSFALRDLLPGRTVIRVHRRGFAPVRLTVLVEPGLSGDPITVSLHRGQFVAGRATDKEGQPAKNIEVIPMQGRDYYLDLAAMTDFDGRYRLEDLPDAVNAVDLLGVGFLPLRRQPVTPGEEQADFQLTRSVKLRGRVLDGRTGAPITDFRIRILSQESPVRSSVSPTWAGQGVHFRSADGTWNSARDQIRAGTVFTLEARAKGFAPAQLDGVIATPNMAPVVFRMSAGGRLSGWVRHADSGQPVPSVDVELIRRQRTTNRPPSFASRSSPRDVARTGADGAFAFQDLPREAFHVLVRREGKLVHLEGPTTPGATELTIWLRPPVTLRGRIRDWQDQLVPAARITLRRIIEARDRASQFSSTSSDSRGRFAVQELVRGEYVISASGKSRTGATVVFRKTLTLGIENESQIDLRPAGRGSLSGAVRLPSGAGRASVRIAMKSPTGVRQTFSTGVNDGQFAISGLPEGECRITLSYNLNGKRLRVEHPKPVLLHAGEAATVSLDDRR